MLQHNALKYRGYYYDADLGLYYLGSRFYDQNICRFVNADTTDVLTVSPTALSDKNLYAYCDNNPVVRKDEGGKFWNIVIGAAVGAAVSAVTTALDFYMTTGSVDLGKVAISAAVGAVSGGIAARTGLGAVAQASGSAIASAAGSVATDVYDLCKNPKAGKFTLKDCRRIATKAVKAAGIGFGSSILGSAFGNGITKGMNNKAKNMVFRGSRSIGCVTNKQARNLVKNGKKLINTARGLSSVIGTTISTPFWYPIS